MNWISVEDGLPEKLQTVLLWADDDPALGWIARKGAWYEYYDGDSHPFRFPETITHWAEIEGPE